MRRLLLPSLAATMLAGCLSAPPEPPACWTLDVPVPAETSDEKPPFGEVRLAVVSIRAPYDSRAFAVLRSDGSVAFDPCNHFAALPTALAKGAALDVLRQTGLFAGVQPAVTTADVKTTLELVIDELALDCRQEGERRAVVGLTLVMIRDRQVVSARREKVSVETSSGNYSAAFGEAFARALSTAAGKLKR